MVTGRLPPGSMCCAGNTAGASASFFGLILLESIFASVKDRGLGGIIAGSVGQAGVNAGEAYLIGRTRELLRLKYNIESPTSCWDSDFFLGLCCAGCSLCQELREIQIQDKKDTRTILQAPKAMRM